MENLLAFADVMSWLGGILAAIVILLAMVTVHEFGHYIAGKTLQFKITEFAVGFGPAVLKKRSKKTGVQFSLRAIPLGGYCAFDGEDDADEGDYSGYYENLAKQKTAEGEAPKEEVLSGINAEEKAEIDSLFQEVTEELPAEMQPLQKEEEKEAYPEPKGERFNDQPPWKRIIVLVAGALMNYLLALLLTFLMLGIYGTPRFEIYQADTEKTWENEVLQVGDTLLEIDGERLYMLTDYIGALDGKKQGEQITITLLRDGEEIKKQWQIPEDVDFYNMSDTDTLFAALGVNAGFGLRSTSVREGFFQTVGSGFEYSFKVGGTVLRSLGELLTGKLSLDAMGGPATTIGVTAKAASQGFRNFLNIAVLIGVNLAVFNLLPVPALDGSKVIFCIIEWIRKKPVNRKVESIIHFVGILLIFGFAIFVDIFHLF